MYAQKNKIILINFFAFIMHFIKSHISTVSSIPKITFMITKNINKVSEFVLKLKSSILL